MNQSLTLVRVAGIPVRVHWSFLLVVGWVAFGAIASGQGAVAAAAGVLLLLSVFACVVLHEFGHALAARRYGIRTEDITLLPIGGVARLHSMPRSPMQELVVALAGPAVNVVIAGFLAPFVDFGVGVARLAEPAAFGVVLLERLFWINLLMVAFNLLPAFPLDGGRVARALLALRFDYTRATSIAATLGRVAGVLFALVGLFVAGNPFLALIGLFVFWGAGREAQEVRLRERMRSYAVSDAMSTRFEVVTPDTPLETVARRYVGGTQVDFPMVEGRVLRGVLRQADLLRWIRGEAEGVFVSELAEPAAEAIDARLPLIDAVRLLTPANRSSAAVVRDGSLVGLLTRSGVERLLDVGRVPGGHRGFPQTEGV